MSRPRLGSNLGEGVDMARRRWVAGALVAAVASAVISVTAHASDDGDGDDAGLATQLPSPTARWTLDLSDDFEQLDERVWTRKDKTYSSNEDSFLRAANCSIDDAGDDGHAVRLQARNETVRKWDRTWRYTSCYLTSEDKYSVPNYFRAQVRAKVPMEQGMWAAPLWFRPVDGSGGEIDLVETLGGESRPVVSQTIHTEYGAAHQQASALYPFAKLDDATGTDWHTYTIEKLPGRITMWVDGVQTAEWTAQDPSWFAQYYETGKRWDLRVNLQVGGKWGGEPDSSTDWTPSSTALLVDRVRVWKPTALALFPLPDPFGVLSSVS
jgi:hypothetical protein